MIPLYLQQGLLNANNRDQRHVAVMYEVNINLGMSCFMKVTTLASDVVEKALTKCLGSDIQYEAGGYDTGRLHVLERLNK